MAKTGEDSGLAGEISAMLDVAPESTEGSDDVVETVSADDLEQEVDGDSEDSEDEVEGEETEDEDDEVEEEEDEEPEPDGTNQKLIDIIANLSKKKEETEKVVEEAEVSPFADESFSELVDVLEIDESGAKKLQTFMTKLLDSDRKQLIKEIMSELPEITTKTLTTQQRNEKVKEQFYTTYKELKAVPAFVSQLSREVAKDTRYNQSVEKILTETAKRAYEALGIKKGKNVKTSASESGEKKTPALPKSSSGRKKTSTVTGVRKEIDDMLSVL